MKKYYPHSFAKMMPALLAMLMVCWLAHGQEILTPKSTSSYGFAPSSKEGLQQADNALVKANTKSATSCRTVTLGGIDNYYYGGEAAADYSVSNTYYNYSHTQFIIRRSELEGYYNTSCGATIYKIYFFISDSYNDVGSSFTRRWTISMGHTNNTQFNSSTYQTGLTTVFPQGNITFSGEGWYEITLTTPFQYNGTQNLVIDVKDNTGSYISGTYPIFGCVESLSNSSIFLNDDYLSGYNSSYGSRSTYRPYCVLCLSPRSNLTYNTNGGGNCSPGTSIPAVSCADEVTLPTTIPSCGGGTFAYWSQYPDGYGTQFSPGENVYMSTNDVTLYAIYHGSLTYNTSYNCTSGGTATSIAPVEDRQVAHVTSVIPTCTSSGSFRYWNTSPDGSGTTYAAGDEVRLDCLGNVTLYAIYCDETYTLTLDNCSHQDNDTCYIDVCLPTSGASSITLSATTDMPNPTYRWSVNEHDGNGYIATTGTTRTVSVSSGEPMGYDIQVTAQSPEGCKASTYGRIRTSNGLQATATHSFDPICAGSGNTITIGTAAGSDITIDEPAVHIEAQLGQGVQTFIPDGPNCVSLGECYSSSVEFRDFDPDAVVDAATDIDYLRINLEHSFIGDLQIKLICPNGQNSIILQDHDNALDPDVYAWPRVYAYVWGACIRYENTGTNGNCVQGDQDGYYYNQYYVVRNGSTYTLTGDQNQATLFTEDELTNAVMTTIYNQTSGTTYVADWCSGNYYYEFYDIRANSDGSTHGKSYQGVGFGDPNRNDNTDDHICDAAYNPAGSGLDYCWSGNTDYSYASGYVYSEANLIDGDDPNPYVRPSDEANHTNFYHPFQDFSNLIGCPLNGTWTVQVCDSWAIDNGYIFDWSLALSDNKLPNSWGYTIETANADFNCASGSITHTIDPNDHSVEIDPQLGDNGTGCIITITDNIGCETTVDVPLVVQEPTIITATGNVVQQEVCQGGAITTNTWTIGGIATGATIDWSPSAPAGVNFSVSGTTVTLSGSNVTAAANTYNYTITTVQPTGCDPVTVSGSIKVNPKPELNVVAIAGNECPNGQSVTVEGTLTSAGTAPYNYTWNIGTLTLATGSSLTINGTNSAAPTIEVLIPTSPCSATYPIGLSVTDAKNCSSTFNPTTIVTVADNGAPTLRSGMVWPGNQTGYHESYPGVDNILTRVPTVTEIASLYEDDCTSPVNVSQDTPIVDSAADCGWGVRVPYTIADNCGHSFTNYINVTGGDNNFTNAPPKDTTVVCPSDIPSETEMSALVPEITICGVTRTVTLDSVQDNITQSCGSRIYYYHYLDANNEPYVWTFTFNIEHTTGPAEQGTHVATSATVYCMEEATEPTLPDMRDACGNQLQPVESSVSESGNNCNGTRVYSYTYRDCADMTTTWTFTYTIHDTVRPVIDPLAQQNAIAADNCKYRMPDLSTLVTATDNCGGEPPHFVSQTPGTNELFDPQATPRTVDVTVTMADACDNQATRVVQVLIPANEASVSVSNDVAICPEASTTLTAQSTDATMTFAWSPATGLDVTSGSQVIASPTVTTTYTVEGTNAVGCHVTGSVTVAINPAVQLSANQQLLNQTVCTGGSLTPINIQYANATLSVSNLPSGLQFNAATGQIQGQPQASGPFTIVATSTYGCAPQQLEGSVTITPPLTSAVPVTSCDTYTWPADGNTYTTSGNYNFPTTTPAGCDSIVTLNLTINRQSYGLQTVAACDRYTWVNGQTYTASTNTPTYTFQDGNAAGCDSIVTLHLTINNSVAVETSEHYCDEYTTQGVTYTADADLVETFATQWDCDSTVTLHLKIHPSYSFSDSTTICNGESYEYHGETYTANSVYNHTYQSIYGCDSVYTLTLNVLPLLNISIDTTIDCLHGWYEMSVETNAEFFHWTSKPQPGSVSSIAMYRYSDEGYDSVIHVAPQVPTFYYVTVGHDEGLLCPQTDSIAVDELIMPSASFEVTPLHVTADMPRWYATYDVNGDRYTVSRDWYVDYELYDQQSQHIYGDYDLRSGNDSVIIELVAHGKFCSDTMHIAIPYIQESLYIPNVFTPGLETNNLFGAEGTGILEFEMWVFNREGLVVFHGTDLDEKWDGTHNGTACPASSYTYRINYKLERIPNSYQTQIGTVMIIR